MQHKYFDEMSVYSICKKITFIVILISSVMILLTINANIFRTSYFKKNEPLGQKSYEFIQEINNNTSAAAAIKESISTKYIINTIDCKIPKTPIMPEYFKKRWRIQNIPNCEYENILSKLNDMEQTLYLFPEYYSNSSSCCLHEVTGIIGKDSNYTLSTCDEMRKITDVKNKEMLITKCGKYLNFEANIPIKPIVQEKINFWKELLTEDSFPSPPPPLNVLFLGIDSVSRSHAYRSLPNSIHLMKEIGFIDFPGYHSVAASTLSNFMAFLMGLTRKDVRKQCSPDWKSPFDSCPFIWKNFSLNNYITMYVEDGSQTFNWGGQSGFNHPPTDYYIHPLFSSIQDLRLKYSGIQNIPIEVDNHTQCSSTETVPQFVLRYTQRFIQKFQQTPFFSFTWFANPFHDYIYSLGNFDKDLFKFFKFIKLIPNFLEKTVIVFVSDHGDRTSFFQSKTIDAFVERGLPPLFIRFPEILKKYHPELDLENVLEQNIKSLISPFDLHHTFLHILSLNKLNIPSVKPINFEPVLKNHQSILVPIESKRNCEKLNIESGNCVCNTEATMEHIKNPFYLTKIIEYVGKKLNHIVELSKYKNICAKWITRVNWILSTQILRKTKRYTDTLIQFSADPGSAHFEVKVRIIHKYTNFDSCKLISNFSRINLYGSQSSCINFVTDADKEMKGFCMCKSQVSRKKT